MDLARTVPIVVDLDTELVAAYPQLARRLTLVLHDADEAQDVAQAAFARALERRHQFRGGDARAWLYTIGIRLALNELRRRRRLVTLDSVPEPDWAMTSQPDLWVALGLIDPVHRAALVLATIDGCTHPEIGTILGVREGTVSSWPVAVEGTPPRDPGRRTMTTFDDRLAGRIRSLDAAIPVGAMPAIPLASPRRRRLPARRLVLLAAVLAVLGGATTSLLMIYGSFGGDAYQFAWTHATKLDLRATDQGYTVVLEAAYADSARMMLAVSVVDAESRGWSGLDASSADVRFTDGSGPAWSMVSGGSTSAPPGAANVIWFDASAPPEPGVHSLTVTVPAVRVRAAAPTGSGDPWHEVLGSWTFTFDLPIGGGGSFDLDASATTVGGVTGTPIRLTSTPTVVRIDVRWSDRGPSTTGWTSVGTAFHDGHEIPMGGGGTVFDIETLNLLAGTEDPSGHWKVVLDETIGDSPGGDHVRLQGPWVLEFDVPKP